MAKDGSNRGGARPGAGRKPKALTEKISEGKTAAVMMEPAELEGVDVPPVKDFLKSPQKSGRELVAEEVYQETYAWLKARGCEKLVTVQMVEQYAMSVSRWIQCEEIVSSTGFLAKHPTTGAAIASPLCHHEPVLHEADQLLLDADIPDREGELLGGVSGEHTPG